jgi:glycosyltransferase involved in cell wall biosynthesis
MQKTARFKMKIAFVVPNVADLRGGNRLLFNIAKVMSTSFNIDTHIYSIETEENIRATHGSTLPSFGKPDRVHFLSFKEKLLNDYHSRILSYLTKTSNDIVHYSARASLTQTLQPSAFMSMLTTRGGWRQSANAEEVMLFLESLAKKYDVIQIGDWNAPLTRTAFILSARLHTITAIYPFYHHFGELNRTLRIPALKHTMIKSVLSKFDKVTVSTPYELDFFRGLGLSNVYFAGEGVDLEQIKNTYEKTPSPICRENVKHILFIGVRGYPKGYPHFLIAIDKVAQQIGYDKLKLTIVGKKQEIGPFSPPDLALEAQKAFCRLKHAGIVTAYTSVSEEYKHALIASCDIIVLPSLFETIPLVALEGWAFKKPCVLAASPSVASIVEYEGDGAFLVQFGDVEGLVNKTLSLLADEDRLMKAGSAGYRKVVETYNLASVCRRLLDIYGFEM